MTGRRDEHARVLPDGENRRRRACEDGLVRLDVKRDRRGDGGVVHRVSRRESDLERGRADGKDRARRGGVAERAGDARAGIELGAREGRALMMSAGVAQVNAGVSGVIVKVTWSLALPKFALPGKVATAV